jgi:hypothetical protein
MKKWLVLFLGVTFVANSGDYSEENADLFSYGQVLILLRVLVAELNKMGTL